MLYTRLNNEGGNYALPNTQYRHDNFVIVIGELQTKVNEHPSRDIQHRILVR